jgi:hypothetical protein
MPDPIGIGSTDAILQETEFSPASELASQKSFVGILIFSSKIKKEVNISVSHI